ncbi:MAG: DinB family protein [Bacteroidota bacterium]|nr:DinB family protein [Bacteroidota bacterium]
MKPKQTDHLPYYSYYIDLVEQDEIVDALVEGKKWVSAFIKSVPDSEAEYAYTDKKWTVKQVLNHMIDTERILCYRALCFARGEKQLLPAFDENTYAANANLKNTDFNLLCEEFVAVREASVLLFKQLGAKELQIKGTTGLGDVTVLSIGYMMCGHALHHIKVIQERYLP